VEERDGMRVAWDAPIPMDDGLVLRCDVFLPPEDGRYPVILSYGPYAKGLAFQEGYPSAWAQMENEHPDVTADSTNKYQQWEVVDPEKWVREGYACVRVDSRGTGTSPGYVDCFSPRETRDFYECIEWAGTQPWSSGKVGLNGISYYAINQWHVASLQPPHLTAMCVWEGAADWYRDMTHHGGILSTFWDNWYDMQVKTVQYGLGDNGPKSVVTGENVCGAETLSEEELASNRTPFGDEIWSHALDDDYHKARSPKWDHVTAPLLSAGNWGGQGLHPRGNFEGYLRAASEQKWLEVHGIWHWTHFYTDYGRELQLKFFDHFLKGEDSGWSEQPRVLLNIRQPGERFELRAEEAWPIPRTEWTRLYLDANELRLTRTPPAEVGEVAYEASGDGVTFSLPPMETDVEITGPVAAKLWLSSSTEDADLFLIVRLFDEAGEEVVFRGAVDPHTPIAQGWLRASHRKLDPNLSLPYRPYHTHDEAELLIPDDVYELDIEIWPTCIVVPSGYRLSLTVQGRDYEYPGPGARLSNFKNELKGCGPFLHDDPRDRPPATFADRVTVYTGGDRGSHLLLPVIPAAEV
jgi:predicted acyl esterase